MINEDKATWTEVTTNMSLMDVMNLNEALNTYIEHKNKVQEWHEKKNK